MHATRKIEVLVAASPRRRQLGELPDGVELVTEPNPSVEVVVLGTELMRELPGLFERLPGLQVALSVFAGVDFLLPIIPPDVVVASATGAHDIGVSEWILAMILAMRRRVPELIEFQRAGTWERNINDSTATGPSPLPQIDDLDGDTALILGHGSIGRATARRLEPFGVRVAGIARRPREDAESLDALPRLLPQADIVVVLLPLTPQTERIVDANFLAQMKPGALLVNAARGRLVDTDALVAALATGRVRAALDVTDPEPLPDGHPLWSAPNVLITPHIAGGVSEWQSRSYRIAGEQIRRYAAGEPLRNVAAR